MKVVKIKFHTSIFSGFIRIFDVFRNVEKTYFYKNDFDAIKSDWEAVGNDMRVAFSNYESSLSSK